MVSDSLGLICKGRTLPVKQAHVDTVFGRLCLQYFPDIAGLRLEYLAAECRLLRLHLVLAGMAEYQPRTADFAHRIKHRYRPVALVKVNGTAGHCCRVAHHEFGLMLFAQPLKQLDIPGERPYHRLMSHLDHRYPMAPAKPIQVVA